MWYFPIRTRFKRLFGNPQDAKHLIWHAEGGVKDGKIRHPADCKQWKTIDTLHHEFGAEDRNLWLALSTDGMSPFGTISSSHSTWPVMLIIYNLPPSLCMKRKYMMLSLLISGPKQPGNDIGVYFAPLINDLKDLWKMGIEVHDANTKQSFRLRAMLFCTINDFPALGNLAGYSVKEFKACPTCGLETKSFWLPHSKKVVYQEHRRYLEENHRYRKLCTSFNGCRCEGRAPIPLSGEEVLGVVGDMNVKFGKKSKNPHVEGWKKRSIFFELPYWKDLFVRHCLDVMHIEKNVCESLVGTLLNQQSKTKDGIKAIKDYEALNIRKELQPDESGKKTYLPPACYTLSKKEKETLLKFLHDVKVLEGFSSNMRNIVSLKDLKLVGMKSHDCHVLMQYLLPAAIRSILPKHVRSVITNLCLFFKRLCKKVIDPDELVGLQRDIVRILCQLEMYFPPSFFDVMLHLTVHLVRELELCGPVYLRWMYACKRYMKILKGYVMNRSNPEGCIVERYVVEEVVEFCTDYLADVEAIGLPKPKHSAEYEWKGTHGYEVTSIDRKDWTSAHLYVLHNLEEVQPYIVEHKSHLRSVNPKNARDDLWITKLHNQTFIDWFRGRVYEQTRSGVELSTTLKLLSKGPMFQVLSYTGFVINNYTFYTKERDDKGTMQNSGVLQVAEGMHVASSKDKNPSYASMSYYGVIDRMWVLIYSSELKIPVFGCKWADNNSGVDVDDMSFTSVALHKLRDTNEPFILASQAKQVFYVPDLARPNWSIVLLKPQWKLDEEDDCCEDNNGPPSSLPPTHEAEFEDDAYLRSDHEEGIWVNEVVQEHPSSSVLPKKRKHQVL